MDAALAAIAIEHGATFCSTDRDFSRFHGLDWHNRIATLSRRSLRATLRAGCPLDFSLGSIQPLPSF